MKKVLPILIISLLLYIIAYSCVSPNYTIYCGKLKEKLMFVPQNAEQGNTTLLYSNRGDSLDYVVSKKEPVKDESFDSECDCACWDNFMLKFNTHTNQSIVYELGHGYRNEWNDPIQVQILITGRNYYFEYTVNKNSTLHSTSTTMLDSLMVNNISYRDVVELTDSVQTIHVAKDYGIVQIIENDSTVWTLNKWED